MDQDPCRTATRKSRIRTQKLRMRNLPSNRTGKTTKRMVRTHDTRISSMATQPGTIRQMPQSQAPKPGTAKNPHRQLRRHTRMVQMEENKMTEPEIKAGDEVTSEGGCTRCFSFKFRIIGKPMEDGRHPAVCTGCGASYGLNEKEWRKTE